LPDLDAMAAWVAPLLALAALLLPPSARAGSPGAPAAHEPIKIGLPDELDTPPHRAAQQLRGDIDATPSVSPLHGLSPLSKPHYAYPPSAALLLDAAAEVLLLDYIRLTGSLTPPDQEDPKSVHRTVQLYVSSVLGSWPSSVRRSSFCSAAAMFHRGIVMSLD
jgi:hypothetical protein